MKRIAILLTLAISLGLGTAYGHTLEEKLKELDYVMERRDTYYMAHEHQIDSLRKRAAAVDPTNLRARFRACHDIYNAYRSYQNDSARVYADKELALAEQIADPELSVVARYDDLFTYMSRGDFTNAVDVLRSTDLSGAGDSIKGEIYVLAARLYSDLSNFTSSRYDDKYARLSRDYARKTLEVAKPESYAAQFATYFLHGYRQNRDERIATFTRMLQRPDISLANKAMLYSMLGDLYVSDNQKDKGLEYKAESAIVDIKSSIRETTSKCFLAYELLDRHDERRATKYIHVALEDAENYNAPQRKSEILRALSLIENSRYNTIEGERDMLWILLIITTLFVAALIALFILLRRRNVRLRQSQAIINKQNEEIRNRNEEISRQNAEIGRKNREISLRNEEIEQKNVDITEANSRLTSLNSQLRESIKIKDEYIGYVFYLISEYIKKIEAIYKLVNLKVTVRQTDELKKLLPLSDVRAEKEKMLKEFDKIFLSLFPTFIEQYNNLFDEEENASAAEKPDGILTPEMRIFALIRLGVTDITDIAQFLNYSINTINTYKTKAKKRSRVPNDLFESKIMQIRSVK